MDKYEPFSKQLDVPNNGQVRGIDPLMYFLPKTLDFSLTLILARWTAGSTNLLNVFYNEVSDFLSLLL